MKKILFFLAIAMFTVPAVSFAGAIPLAVSLSNGVSASYFVDDATAATEYSISTGHDQGNRIYFSGNSDARIYYNEIDVKFTSGDLLGAHVSSFASDADSYTGVL